MSYIELGRRMRHLRYQQDRRAARAVGDREYYFRVRPTCPPTTSLMVMPGRMYRNAAYWAWISYDMQVPQYEMDFTAPTDFGWRVDRWTYNPLPLNFADAGYYQAVVVGWYFGYLFYTVEGGPGSADVDIVWTYDGGQVEYATAAEAEAKLDHLLNGGTDPGTDPFETGIFYADRMPLVAVVLRNNGVMGVDSQILPIDAVNRGRSYIYRDVRPVRRMVA